MVDVIKFIIAELKPFRKTVLLCSSLAAVAALLGMAGPAIMGWSVDLAGQKSPFLWYGGALAIWFAMRTATERIRGFIASTGSIVGVAASERYAAIVLKALMRKPLAFHYAKKSQESSEKITDLKHNLLNLIEGGLFELAPAFIAVAAILGYLAAVDWRIAAALAAAIAASIAYVVHVTPRWIVAQKEADAAHRDIATTGWDGLRNILVIKSTTGEAAFGRTLENLFEKVYATQKRSDATMRRFFNKQDAVFGAGSFAALLIAIYGFSVGSLTLGRLTAVIAYVFTIFSYVQFVHWQYRSLLRAASSYRAVKEVLATPSEDFESGRPIELRGDVEFRQVRFRYREDKPTLEDVSFAAKCGRRVAIVGESGEGKTTLVDLIGRYYEPQSGQVLLDGVDARDINLVSLRSQMAYVPQDLTLFHDTLRFNILYGRPNATDEQVREAARLAHLEDFIQGLPEKYETIVGERGLKLSGGERQRVALARAFLRNPRILILDEPTSNLDSRTEEHVRASLERLMRGRTAFIIAHRLRTIRDADLILVLKDGRIAETGAHADLICRPDGAYAALLKAQGGFISPDEPHLGEELSA